MERTKGAPNPKRLPIPDCAGCGACCMSIGHPPFYRFATGASADPHWAALPSALRDEVDDYIAGLSESDAGRPCLWLDLESRRCTHYEHRPAMCRNFEPGTSDCHRARSRLQPAPLPGAPDDE